MQHRHWGLVALLSVTVIWGTTFPAMKQLSVHLQPLHIIALRFGLAALALLPLLRGMRAAEWRWGVSLGLLNFIAFWLQIEGLALTSSNRNAFVTGLNVLMVPLLAWAVLRRQLSWPIWAACALALLGLRLMFYEDSPWNLGDSLTLASALCFALFILSLEACALRNRQAPLRATRLAAAVALTMFCGSLLVLGAQDAGWSQLLARTRQLGAGAWAAVVYLALAASVLVVVLQAWGQQRVDAMRSAIIYGLEPVFAAITAWLLIGEHMGPLAILGAALLVLALMLSQLGSQEAPGQPLQQT